MNYGYIRDYVPVVLPALPSREESISVEFVVDTGFVGDLAIPSRIADQLHVRLLKNRKISLADGTYRECPYGYIALEWGDEERRTEVLVLEGRPLLGMMLLEGTQLSIDVQDGGEVIIESS